MYRLMQFLLLAIFFTSCQQEFIEQDNSQILGGDITPELAPYFRTFQDEARQYGIIVDYESANVTAELINIDEGSVAGACSTNGHNIRDITIDKSFWNRANSLLREMVIFHELGHCILGRGHSEGSLQNGICRSIMRSGLGSCRDAYNTTNRDYYLEELSVEKE